MVVDALTEAVFRSLSRLRYGRGFHPDGVAFEATWVPSDDDRLPRTSPLRARAEHAVVRLSRGAGLPRGLPDVLGVAVKIPDLYGPGRDQDLLLASVGRGPARRVLFAARRFTAAPFSTILPYRTPVGRSPVLGEIGGPDDTSLGMLRTVSGDPGLAIRLWLLPDVPLATVRLGARLPDAVAETVCYDPFHTGDDLSPTGLLNRLRRPAYQASQAGRPDAAQH